MSTDEKYMRRCIELAYNGVGLVAPNPMVGAVLVLNDRIIGEGWHREYGAQHAEVVAINHAIKNLDNQDLLSDCTLYVNLEPCIHFGKTPPCCDLILKKKISRIVIGSRDTNKHIEGSSIERFKENGQEVRMGVLEEECRYLNRRFFIFYEKKRPYIILKWAQSKDGFIDINRDERINKSPVSISNDLSRQLVHKWRTEEYGITVGKTTVEKDNPKLNSRYWSGKNPVRISLDRELSIPSHYNIYDNSQSTIIFTNRDISSTHNTDFKKIDFSKEILPQILEYLFLKNVQSIIVEGGSVLINSFIESKLWDEIKCFIGLSTLKEGVRAPYIKNATLESTHKVDDDILNIYSNSIN
ncbi:bifunctional diaminohydroxyphosphoribosylaminopyrimidine deaminase/5-amino-6-(5-phosphoribosylamino)uracil reductase RibD [Ichthyobacterium seriolicida]|uniref:Riboflavin biosynthesis protein RibD n=1 Tax=Ichthyobacterium seriolicida TaxID=242600 RepID=A0A1J1EAU2_9FLAO|nr:bifunctional diaminohydroxyphosphoribosylaminopyrimidine deaminase/5-amino-6-(5-phosphoribosylamino)uracil reductase RibD [Ichthyobacterium seriolicida]BAV95059.1 riboflavin biosynthesis protein ribD [Ichthyobacterium seriolicida]